jgi:hypothetical protein
MLYHAVPCCTMLYHVVPCCTTLVPCCTTLVPCCTVLYHPCSKPTVTCKCTCGFLLNRLQVVRCRGGAVRCPPLLHGENRASIRHGTYEDRQPQPCPHMCRARTCCPEVYALTVVFPHGRCLRVTGAAVALLLAREADRSAPAATVSAPR